MHLVRTLLSSSILCGTLLVAGASFADVPGTGGGGGAAATTAGSGGSTAGSGGGAEGGGSGSSTSDDSGCTVSKPGDSVAAGTMTALAVLALAIAGGSRRKKKSA